MDSRTLVYSENVRIQFIESILGCSSSVIRKVDGQEYIALSLNRESYDECKEATLSFCDRMESKGWLSKK